MNENNPQTERALSFGQKLTGVNFNPSGDPSVTRLKEIFAEAADIVRAHHTGKNDALGHDIKLGEMFREGALDRILDAQMWAVKHVTH